MMIQQPTLIFYRLLQIFAGYSVLLALAAVVDFILHPLAPGVQTAGATPFLRALFGLCLGPLNLAVGILVVRRTSRNVVGLMLMIWGGYITSISLSIYV